MLFAAISCLLEYQYLYFAKNIDFLKQKFPHWEWTSGSHTIISKKKKKVAIPTLFCDWNFVIVNFYLNKN